MKRPFPLLVVMLALAAPALAGPPYVSDDPEPTDYKHFEIYAFGSGTKTTDGTSGQAGIDFNYRPVRPEQYPDCREISLLASG